MDEAIDTMTDHAMALENSTMEHYRLRRENLQQRYKQRQMKPCRDLSILQALEKHCMEQKQSIQEYCKELISNIIADAEDFSGHEGLANSGGNGGGVRNRRLPNRYSLTMITASINDRLRYNWN